MGCTSRALVGAAVIFGSLILFIAIRANIDSSEPSSVSKGRAKASVSASQYVVEVTNLDDFEWQSLTLIANGLYGYRYEHPYLVPAGETITVRFNQFSKGEERLNPLTTKVSSVAVHVSGYDAPVFNVR